jgi:hypothetical protein
MAAHPGRQGSAHAAIVPHDVGRRHSTLTGAPLDTGGAPLGAGGRRRVSAQAKPAVPAGEPPAAAADQARPGLTSR